MNQGESDVKRALREWIVRRAHRPVDGELRDDTPILERRVITSLQVMELILFVQKTAGRPVDVAQLKPSSFRSIDHIYRTFFTERADGHADA
jgi:hypothetical protein